LSISIQILISNIHKVKLSTPDYKGVGEKEAVADFMARRANYETYYEPVDESDGPFCKIVNSHRYVVHNIRGYLSLKVVHFVMNLHTLPRTFYLTRHGQSEYNLLGKIGGDSGLTPAGIEYARRLAIFAKEEIARPRPEDQAHNGEVYKALSSTNSEDGASAAPDDPNKQRPCRLWTSTLRRTQETAQFIEHSKFNHTFDNGDNFEWLQFRKKPRRNLDELYAGTCDGMTYKEIQEVYPEEFSRRQADKLSYRYPRGESYMDVTLRLEPLAQEMERIREPLLIVGHQGILRILYAYFMGLDRKEAPYVSIPLNNVIELTPHAYGCHEKRYCLMMKEEMLADGQDEPVTSMPVGDKHGDSSAPLTNMPKDPRKGMLKRTGRSVQEIDAKYAKDDPIMNAPSC
jgi:broad specificity phosphatase PhoE